MSDEDDLTLLVESHNPVQTASYRSLLEGHEIGFVIQGEHHAGMITGAFDATVVVPGVLVAKRDLERARALLAASPDLSGTESGMSSSIEGAICPVHEEAAVATCGRCGTFLCSKCSSLGNPPTCQRSRPIQSPTTSAIRKIPTR